jgi:uncharacterized protein YjbI with pentapeptide repeats
MSDEPQRPTSPDDREGWNAYWTALGMLWRTEPEIDEERQRYLVERQGIPSDYQSETFPYSNVNLTRVDVEWLLSCHESLGMTGPVDWSDPHQHEREGVDLKGANLRGVDLSRLPLARTGMKWAHVEEAKFEDAQLEHASFYGAHGAGAIFYRARMHRANLVRGHFSAAALAGADLTEATFGGADLRQADLSVSDLSGANLPSVQLGGADMRRCRMDANTELSNARLGDKEFGFACVADVLWGEASVAAINWSVDETGSQSAAVNRDVVLGDERLARNPADIGHIKVGLNHGFGTAIRAYRQLAAVLRNQGANEQADELMYRAQLLRKHVLFKERRWPGFVSSMLINLLSGYGYRPRNAFAAYALVIALFTGLYLLNSHFVAPHLTWNEALVLSMSSFHGRGFFNPNIQLGDTYAQLAAVEALVGLLIEITFIATFTQRFFAR